MQYKNEILKQAAYGYNLMQIFLIATGYMHKSCKTITREKKT